MSGTPGMRAYEGRDITVRFDARRCIHAAVCVHGLPGVFDPDRRPWVLPDAAPAADVAEVVMRCPTGALTYEPRPGGQEEPTPETNTISVAADGPLLLRGDVEMRDASGRAQLEGPRVALCRCGASRNKPYCDGAHAKSAFQDEGRVAEVASNAETRTPTRGRVVVKPASNGPLLVSGSFDVEGTAGGRLAFRDGRAAMCRCGASKNRPLCDGAHQGVGFQG